MTRTMDMENNHKLDWFFCEYVYGTGIPHYEFHADVQSTPDGKFKMVGSFKRTGVLDGRGAGVWRGQRETCAARTLPGDEGRHGFLNSAEFKSGETPGQFLGRIARRSKAVIRPK
jgi:hypothetical protein